jgi:DNA-binding transcriptional regulator YiaG
MPMTPKQLRAALRRLGLSQVAAADALGVAARTVRTWLKGTRAMPEPAARLLLTWLKHPELLQPSRAHR